MTGVGPGDRIIEFEPPLRFAPIHLRATAGKRIRHDDFRNAGKLARGRRISRFHTNEEFVQQRGAENRPVTRVELMIPAC